MIIVVHADAVVVVPLADAVVVVLEDVVAVVFLEHIKVQAERVRGQVESRSLPTSSPL